MLKTVWRLTSLNKCIRRYGPYLSTPYVLHSKDVEQKDGIVYLPLYMAAKYQRKRIKAGALDEEKTRLFLELMDSRSKEHTGGRKVIVCG